MLMLCALALSPRAAAAAELTVFAAASLGEAFGEIGERFRRAGGQPMRFAFASSSTLARQIDAGAPAGVFVSADTQWMDWLAQRRLIAAETRVAVAGNRLVFIAPADRAQPLRVQAPLDLAPVVGDGRIAVGDPAHVPAGRYARQALVALRAWSFAEPRLVRADSVRAALALVERGEVPLGLVYATDAGLASRVRVVAVVPPDAHAPIVYPAAVVARGDSPAARAFVRFLGTPEAQDVLRRHGFTRP